MGARGARRRPTLRDIIDPLEDVIHKEVVERLRIAHDGDFFHVANERIASYGGHAHFKAMGVESGVADLILFPVEPSAPTCALELKKKGGTLRPKQRAWLARAAKRGWTTAVAYSTDEALGILRGWGYNV